jgi:pyridoxamine 5'-phosphate oxidase
MDFDHPPTDPVAQARLWLEEARAKSGLPNPNAMSLATVDSNGQPSSRMVLLKELDERGAVFYTNRDSRKGLALESNPRAALLLHWDSLDRQLRIEGTASHVSDEESDVYFASRPLGSRIGAWASKQSQPLTSRAALMASAAMIGAKYLGRSVPRPPHWGGYRISLERVEFWQGRESRLHDRIVYAPDGRGGWTITRLMP